MDVLWHLAARAGGGLPRPPFLPCCMLSPACFPIFVPFLPSPAPSLAVCLRSLSIFPLPVVITLVLSCEILPLGLHAAHPHPPELGAFSSYPHLIPALLASSAIWEPRWTPVPCLLKSPPLSSVPTCDSLVLPNCAVSVNQSPAATLPPC